jgi:geranylgeranyl diphosphate synthase, type I
MPSQTDFKTYLKQSAEKIETELHVFSTSWNKEINQRVPELVELTQLFTHSFFGGKLLRGTLVRLGYELVQPTATPAIYKPAAAFEIVHTGFLIHDDIIDQSPTRRGKPAVHIHKDNHYGVSQAICLGDLGLTLATKLITDSDYPVERKNSALSFFLQIVTDTILGEMLDIQSSRNKTINE